MLGLATHDNYYTKWYTYDEKPLPGMTFIPINLIA